MICINPHSSIGRYLQNANLVGPCPMGCMQQLHAVDFLPPVSLGLGPRISNLDVHPKCINVYRRPFSHPYGNS